MKVSELIKLLVKCDQDAEIVLAVDEEGNDFSKIGEVVTTVIHIDRWVTIGNDAIDLGGKKGYVIWPK